MNKDHCVNLTSFSIKEGTIPDSWPLAHMLQTTNPDIPSRSLVELGKRTRGKRNRVFKTCIQLKFCKTHSNDSRRQPTIRSRSN
jgi:hypothetical protein